MAAEDRGARAAAADLIDAFNQADWERFRSRVTDDVVYEETGTGRRVDDADTYVELCQGWRRALPDCRGTIRAELADDAPYVIMLTASDRAVDRERAAEAGVDEFLAKPFSPIALRDRVVELIGASS
jgi:DNA-binding NarL/FixJ family response regulator